VMNGLFDTNYQLFRYNVPFNTFFFVFIAIGLAHWRDVIAKVAPGALERRRWIAVAGTPVLALAVLLFDLNPLRGFLVTERDYRETGTLYRAFRLGRHPDFKAVAAYIGEHADAKDAIVAFDPREIYYYIGRLEYSVQTSGYESQSYVDADGTLRDLYLSTPVLTSLEELRAVLGEPGRTKWLIVREGWVRRSPRVADDMKAFVQSQAARVVYAGRDGSTKVYRFE
jgi:hypothetical protein